LPTLLVPVKQVNRELFRVLDAPAHPAVVGISGLPDGRLPETHVVAGDEEVAHLHPELLRFRMR
jgi:hypothetical protein